MEDAVAALKTAKRVVVFTGAGMSADSGIATFRTKGNGVWNGLRGTLALAYFGTPFGWSLTPQWGWKAFIRDFYSPIAAATVNAGHIALVDLQEFFFSGDKMQIITMNVDGLHQAAGTQSCNVHEVHGTVRKFRCVKHGHAMDIPLPLDKEAAVPKCPECRSTPRPDCVLFTESLPGLAWSRAEAAINKLQKGDVMLVIGTSSVVYPAASLPEMASRKGATVVEVNLDHPTPISDVANICVQGKAAEVLQEMVSKVCS